MTQPESNRIPPPVGLLAKLWRARLALIWERLWPAVWPAVGVAGLFVALALLDLLPQLPGWLHAVVLAAFATVLIWLGVRAARRFALPDENAARRRLEQASGLAHRPLTAVDDSLATGTRDPEATALWRLHQRRMADAVRRLRVGWPAPGLARRDPWTLRGALLLFLVIASAIGWTDAGDRLLRALTPEFATGPAETVALDLWITPPAYTGMAPLFPIRMAEAARKQAQEAAKAQPKDGADDAKTAAPEPGPVLIKVPVGSTLTAQLHGQGATPRLLIESGAASGRAAETPFTRVDDSHAKLETTLKTGGMMSVERGGATLGRWNVVIVPDLPPTIAFDGKPQATPQATLRLSYKAGDDFGLAKVTAEIRRSYEKGAVIGKEMTALELALPGRNAKSASETGFYDLAPHKWAGLPVVMELVATDALGQQGRSERIAFTLPERVFNNPVARAIIEQRKRLIESPDRREAASRALEDIAARPVAFNNDSVVFLALISARSRLLMDPDDKAVDSVVDLLWDTALRLEDGRLSISERDMRRLQEQLMKALADGAPDAELERLMAELRRAMDRYMAELMRQMMQNPQNQQTVEFDPSTMQMIDMNDLQRMLDQIRDLMRSGARDAARQMLSQLQQMMESLRAMQFARMPQGAMRGNSAMRQLQDLIRRQQQLMDRTFRQTRPGQGTQPGGRPSPADQRALQQMLRQMRNMMQGMQQGQGQGQQGQQGPGQFLDRADDAMGRAARSLENGQPGEAVGSQGEALDQLRRAGQGMMQQMMDRFARETGTTPNRANQRGQPRHDPLGREIMGEDVDSSDVSIPDEGALARAREILDELRRRAGQSSRPRIELDYINRLLDRF